MKKSALSISGAMVVGTTLLAATSWGANIGQTINITPGVDIVRTWTDVQNAGYVYGAKQSYDSLAGTTHVWLPYGDVNGVYYDADTISFINAAGGAPAQVAGNSGSSNNLLTYKFHFNQPIGTLKLTAGWSYWVLGPDGEDVTAGAVEYSMDGISWETAWTKNSTDLVPSGWIAPEPLLNNYLVSGLNNQDVYLRFRTYNQTNPADTDGGSRYMQLRTSGAPDWPEGAFFGNQMQLEVTTIPEPAALSLLALGALALSRRRR